MIAAFARGAVAVALVTTFTRLEFATGSGAFTRAAKRTAFAVALVAAAFMARTTETTRTLAERLAATRGAAAAGRRTRRALGFQTGDGFRRNRLADVVLDTANLVALGVRGQRERQAAATGAAGTADTVHVVFGLHRQVEVDGVADALHVDAAGGNVGGNQNTQLAALQLRQRTGALALVHVAVQGSGGKALVGQAIGQVVSATLGGREDDGLIQLGVAQHVIQQLHLVAGIVRVQQALRDVGVLFLGAGHLDTLRVAHHLRGQLGNRAVQRGREQQRLAVFRQAADDGFDVFNEAHVQHAVGFVQHQRVHGVQLDATRLQVIDQAAGGGDQHVNATRQGLQLGAVGHAAHNGGGAQVSQLAAIGGRGFGDLQGQFAGRGQHQHLHADALVGGHLGNTVQGRQHEGGGLAAARLRGHHQVVAGQRLRNGGSLDRGGGIEASFLNGRQQSGCKTQVFERHYFPLPQTMRRSAWSGQGIRRPDPGDG
ncbi:hypothetical protein D3C72_931490 [compost metagenome]